MDKDTANPKATFRKVILGGSEEENRPASESDVVSLLQTPKKKKINIENPYRLYNTIQH